ncbi:MAG: cytochrome C oxidase subunit IV family protein [Bryobacteraceae bacterium]|nr:cytochrome C oxidase subunit IV family protein [Bryobacterales bacterium]MEB2363121.1 cytochrome C oxidase subunit IV family protein [Bryobacterales bacterium]NUN03684.1 cytochrome C oxidase subunit IV family protein [Bryobacteraceae bacterium]
MSDHIVPIRTYFVIFMTLLIFTLITVGVALVDLGRFNVVVALAIAGIKATLVVLFFMHVRWSSPLTKIFIAASLFWLAILLGFTAADYISRAWTPLGLSW